MIFASKSFVGDILNKTFTAADIHSIETLQATLLWAAQFLMYDPAF